MRFPPLFRDAFPQVCATTRRSRAPGRARLLAAALAAALWLAAALPANAGGIVVRNLTRKTYFCTIQGESALHPQAQAFIFPGSAFTWTPPGAAGQGWRISVIHDDNGLTTGEPLRTRLDGSGGDLQIQESPSGPRLGPVQNHARKDPASQKTNPSALE